jgi:hypothetical protein
MTHNRIAWGIAVADLAAFLVARTFDPSGDIGTIVVFGIGIGSFAAVGALLDTRVPGNPIGVLLLAAGTLLAAAMVIGTYATLGALQVPPWPWAGPAAVVGSTLFVYPFVIALIGVPLVFPDGRLLSPRFRWVVRIAIADMAAFSLGGVLRALLGGASSPDVPGRDVLDLLLNAVDTIFFVATIASFGAGAVAIWLRFRHGGPVQRQQVKLLVAVVSVGAIVLPVSFLPGDASPELAGALTSVVVLTLFALPIVIAVAILRYRLFDIDRIISRTISWAVVSGILAAAFAGVVVAMQAVLAGVTQGETLGVAASTLVAAALFQPVRRRVQSVIDGRFNRSHYDAQRTAAAFAERLRDQMDLATLEGDFAGTVDAALRPRSTGVWIRDVRRAASR